MENTASAVGGMNAHSVGDTLREEQLMKLRDFRIWRVDEFFENALCTAVDEGDEVRVRDVLARGGDPRVTFPTDTGGSWCLVVVAAQHGHTHLLPFLLEAGLSVEGHGSSDQTPLMLAARKGYQRTVEALLDHGADPLATDNAGWTALHWAALCGRAECVSTLTPVTPPCPEVLRAADAHTPVHLASCGGHVGVVKALEEAGWPLFILDSDALTPLHWAVKRGCQDVVKYLINKDVQPSTNDSGVHTPLNLAVKEGKDLAKRWLAGKSGAGHVDAARSLQRKVTLSGEVKAAADDGGLSVHGREDTLRGEELMKLFSFRKWLVDSFIKNALRTAVDEGDEARVKDVLSRGGDPQVTFPTNTGGSWCLVAVAALHGHTHLLPCLLEAGLSVKGHGSSDKTPLMLAAWNGHQRTVEALLDHGADPLATDNAGKTALHHAVEWDHDECASALTASTLLATQDSSSLHGAAEGGSLETEKPLMEKGVEPFKVKGKHGLTLQDMAVMQGSHLTEEWLVKRGVAVHMDAPHCLYLMRVRRINDENVHDQFVSTMVKGDTALLKRYIPKNVDGLMMDADGLTLLHCAAQRGLSPECVTTLLQQGVSPHVLTPDGLTPEDLARRAGHKEALEALRQHQCEQIAASPEDLYEELISFIVSGDDVKAVSSLLCKGVPLEPVGSCSNSALRLAVILDRRRTVSLLLASGAMLPASLLQEAWQSPDVSSGVLATLTNTYLCRLLAERRRLTEHGHKHIIMEGVKLCRVDVLLKGTDVLLMAIKGDAPWKAAWPKDKPQLLSALMAEAVLADCPVMAGFLHRAGAWSFARGEWGSSALSSALEAGHNHMIERLIRHLGGCIYVPDADGRLPRDMLLEAERRHLEQNLFQREWAELKDLKLRQKSESGKKAVCLALKVQEELYASYVAERPQRSLPPADGRSVLQLSVRKGLVQLTYLVVQLGRLHVDEMLDSVCGTTALHEAASHGQDSCVELLLGIGAIPIRPDRYGQTPRLLAAMFGHKSTEQLLALREPRDPHCRAGTTAEQASSHYDAYLRSYDRVGRAGRESLTPIDRHDPARVTCKLLGAIGVHELWQKAKEVVVDFSCGEALEVKNVVMKELQTIMDKVAQENSLYRGCLRLVGSSQDQSKIYSPDEFDVNLVITPKNVRVDVKETPKESAKLKGKLQMSVVDDTPGLQGNKFMENLFLLVQKCLTKYTLQDERLSLVPPGLSSTQVGAALALAWQGRKYPLLLVGVDLVPVLELPWHEKIIKPEFLKDKARTFHVSNTADGSWRCSFALTEAMVLKSLAPIKRLVLVMGKVLLSCLKADPWMPQDMKFHCTWFINREWKIVAPSGFCFKNAFLRWLEQLGDEELVAEQEEAHFCAKELIAVFRQLCAEPNVKRGHLTPANISAYFGGDFEGIKPGEGAHLIARCLEENLENEQ